jgi:hypothetical protein
MAVDVVRATENSAAASDASRFTLTADAATSTHASTAVRLPRRRGLWLRRLWHRVRGARPTFEMHVVARREVEQAIGSSGGRLLCAVDDNAAGASWLSYTYICRKEGRDDSRGDR